MALGGTAMTESGMVRVEPRLGARRQAASGTVVALLLGLLIAASLTACATAPPRRPSARGGPGAAAREPAGGSEGPRGTVLEGEGQGRSGGSV
jgi:hypothetical protein